MAPITKRTPIQASRSAPVHKPAFRGGLMMGLTDDGPRLLMVCQDYDLALARTNEGLGPPTSAVALWNIPEYPWFYRRAGWQLQRDAQWEWCHSKLFQSFGDSPKNINFERVILIEIDLDSPLGPVDQSRRDYT